MDNLISKNFMEILYKNISEDVVDHIIMDYVDNKRIKKHFAYVKQMKKIRKRMDNRTFIDFDGKNCDDCNSDSDPKCHGWDGISRRCDCGNRRVDWEKDEYSETGYRAVAY
jgi:hypothetical protein